MPSKGERRVRVLTADGEIELSRRYFWGKGQGGACPADEPVGIEQGRTSPGAREILCRLGLMQDFGQAAEDADRIGNVPVCKEKLRQLVEAEAASITANRNSGQIKAVWTSAQAKVKTDTGIVTRVYAGVDGVMAPMVTAAEKEKRRKNQAIRRQQRSASGVGNIKALPPARAGSDERFKEMKIGLFYDQTKEHRHVFVTEDDHEAFGVLLKKHAGQVAFEQADQSISLTDGAKWIASQICSVLLLIKAMLLDFYHLSQHVHEAARCCLGETQEATDWVMARLKELKELGVTPMLAAIDALDKKLRSQAKRQGLKKLRDYVVSRVAMLDYRGAMARGWDIGSGPTEAMCKNLTLRLKRPGMKWDRDHAGAMMNLIGMYESGQAKAYWAAAA
jgi:ribosome-associated translation inhibitor RaiA